MHFFERLIFISDISKAKGNTNTIKAVVCKWNLLRIKLDKLHAKNTVVN